MAEPNTEHTPLALGIERIGLLALRWPVIATIVVILLTVGAVVGIGRITVDDSLSQLFRSDTPEFQQYEEVTRRFPSSEFDILIVLESDNLLERDSLEAMRNLAIDVQLVPGTLGVLSLFSAREPPEEGRIPPPLFPDELPTGAEYDALVDRVMTNEIIHGKLLSEDAKLALMVLSIEPDIVHGGALRDTVAEIRQMIDEDLAGTDVVGRLSGVPIMQLEIRNAVERDRLIYNIVGFAAGCLIAVVFFRRFSFMIIAAGPPLMAIVWSLGFLGWLDFRLNMFLNVMTPLVMVLGFSDSMQITYAARERLLAGQSKYDAMRAAILVVGPACVLTSTVAAISFLVLYLFSESHLIRTFGAAGAISCVVAFLAVIVLVPLLSVLFLRNEAKFADRARSADAAMEALRGVCRWSASHGVRRPGFYSLLSLLVVGGLTVLYTGLDPRYRLADQVPDKEQAVAASNRIDAKLAGANPIDVLIEFPEGTDLFTAEPLGVIADVHAAMENETGVANVWSVESLQRWIVEKVGRSDIPILKQYVEMLPPNITRRFVAESEDAVVVAGRIPDKDASELLPVINDLDRRLDAVRTAYPGYQISVTGLSAIAARNSASMIQTLSGGLGWEMLFVAGLIGITFRSLTVMLVAILPGLFPIVISGAVLWVMGEGLQFASIVALTIAFGLGLSATIHYLNRLRLEHRPDEDPSIGVKRATVLVGPALILTSVVLACGLGVTIFSDLPSLHLFGWLSAFTLIAALAGDLLILPATVMWLRTTIRRLRGKPAPPQAAE